MGQRVIRVLVVDDSLLFRTVCAQAFRLMPGVEVVGTASGGRQALDRINRLRPDLVTLDIHMPDMTGLEVLRAIKAGGLAVDCAMVSGTSSRESLITMEALELGALDFVAKENGDDSARLGEGMVQELARVIAAVRERRERGRRDARVGSERSGEKSPFLSRVVAIGVSTGGPRALAEVLPRLPKDFSVPVLVVQHMPKHFTRSLAESLDARCSLPVREGRDGEPVQAGVVYIAPGGLQMGVVRLQSQVVLRILEAPAENNCRPSADYLFRSLVPVYGRDVTGVIMTGMGRDGCAGLSLIHEAGGTVLAQDAESSTVFGMPARVVEAGLADRVVPLRDLAREILQTVRV